MFCAPIPFGSHWPTILGWLEHYPDINVASSLSSRNHQCGVAPVAPLPAIRCLVQEITELNTCSFPEQKPSMCGGQFYDDRSVSRWFPAFAMALNGLWWWMKTQGKAAAALCSPQGHHFLGNWGIIGLSNYLFYFPIISIFHLVPGLVPTVRCIGEYSPSSIFAGRHSQGKAEWSGRVCHLRWIAVSSVYKLYGMSAGWDKRFRMF